LEKRSTCFLNKEEIVNYENQVFKKLNEKESNNINKQEKQKEKKVEKSKEKDKVMKKRPNPKKIYVMPVANKSNFLIIFMKYFLNYIKFLFKLLKKHSSKLLMIIKKLTNLIQIILS